MELLVELIGLADYVAHFHSGLIPDETQHMWLAWRYPCLTLLMEGRVEMGEREGSESKDVRRGRMGKVRKMREETEKER